MSTQTHPTILDGKKVSAELLASLTQDVKTLHQTANQLPPPKLVVMLVGEDPASQVYVNKKAKTAQQIGLLSEVLRYPQDVDEAILKQDIQRLNADPTVHGVLIQLPLPKHLNSLEILSLLDPAKDVDGLHPMNLGRLMMGQDIPAKPCTPSGIMTLLKTYDIPISGQNAVVIGRSNIVGKPMGLLLLAENATVTYAHSRTRHLADVTRQADILIVAAGVPQLITEAHIKAGAVVIDVGINRVNGKLTGDVAYEDVYAKASHITPVPGGVGPMTIATLMANTLALYRQTRALQALQ